MKDPSWYGSSARTIPLLYCSLYSTMVCNYHGPSNRTGSKMYHLLASYKIQVNGCKIQSCYNWKYCDSKCTVSCTTMELHRSKAIWSCSSVLLFCFLFKVTFGVPFQMYPKSGTTGVPIQAHELRSRERYGPKFSAKIIDGGMLESRRWT